MKDNPVPVCRQNVEPLSAYRPTHVTSVNYVSVHGALGQPGFLTELPIYASWFGWAYTKWELCQP